MIYAPVIIPTLNRYEHFRKCLESLESCTGAEHTDVYVALDYPPSEKYVEGWKKNDAYLKEKESDNRFKSLTVYRRKENYFFSGKGNLATAVKDLPNEIDRFILSEDDNVFSPNFLEFINKGLEKFNDDPSVLAICGYSHPYDVKVSDNNYFLQNVDFSAWGYGIWKSRIEAAYVVDRKYLRNKLKSFSNIMKLKRNGLNRLLNAIQEAFSNKTIPINDNTLSVYMALEDMNVVMPVNSKVRNEGWDGSGINCQDVGLLADVHLGRVIDIEKHFDYQGDGMNFYEENKKIYVKSSYAKLSYLHFLKCLLIGLVRKLK